MESQMEQFKFITLIIIGLLVVLEVCYFIYHMMEKRQSARRIFHRWGNPEEVTFSKEELSFIKEEARRYQDFLIDDITWNDLDMDTLYTRMNASMSSAGDIGLYRMLRCPSFSEETIQQRYALQKWLLEHEEDRDKIRSALYKIKFQGNASLLSIYDQANESSAFAYGMLTVTLLAIAALFFYPTSVLAIVILLIFNYAVSYLDRTRRNEAYVQILQIYRYVQALHTLDRLELKECFTSYQIHPLAQKMKNIQHSLFDDLHTGDSGIFYVIAHFFYGEMLSYQRLYKKIKTHEKDLKQVILMMQELDALLSAASFQSIQPVVCEATFQEAVEMQGEAMVHPLLHDPIANDVDVSSHILISGSNASGKSTYLKMIAINCIFAQSFGFAFAKQYRACLFQVYTSMSLRDSLQEKDSYFVAEVRSIQRILSNLNEKRPLLCMIDEILRGTNTLERIAAASEILMSFVHTPSLCLSATHDIELTSILSNHYKNMHFQEQVDKDQLSFDYHIQEGAGVTHNALKLLEMYGYDKRLIAEALTLQKIYEQSGRWQAVKKEVSTYGI